MTEILINGVSLDIFNDIPISLNYSIADIKNPEKRNTSFSKTITLPGSKKNNLLFSNIFEISKESNSDGSVNFSPDFDPTKKASCQLYVNTLLQMDGYAQLLKIVNTKSGYEYEICIFGVLGDFFTNIEGKLLTDLDFTEYSHTLTQSNVESSWNVGIKKDGVDYENFTISYELNKSGEVFDSTTIISYSTLTSEILNGDIIYINGLPYIVVARADVGSDLAIAIDTPTALISGTLIDIGKGRIATPTGEGYVYPCIYYGYGNNMYNYDALTMYPSIYMKSYVDKIFELSGFTYSGDFKELELFKRLVIPASSSVERVSNSANVGNTATQSYTTNTIVHNSIPTLLGMKKNILLFPNTISDTSNLFDVSTGIYTVRRTGLHEVVVDYNITVVGNTVIGGAEDGRYVAGIVRVYAEYLSGSNYIPMGGNSLIANYQDGTFTGKYRVPSRYMNQGDKIRISLDCFNGNTLTVNAGMQMTIAPISVPIAIGDVVNPNAIIPKNKSAKDFILSWVRMFNLYLRVDEANPKNIIIESAKDFYKDNSVKDWTNKIDRSATIDILPVSELEGKEYVFAYQYDEDYYNQTYRDVYREVYGNRNLNIDNDFAKGKKEISVMFSPTVSVGSSINKMVVPVIAKRNDTGLFETFDSNIRILYYGGLKDCQGSFKIKYVTDVIYTKYPYVGHVDDPHSPTVDLLFEIPKALYWSTGIYTTANLYNVYYKKFIEEITDRNSKVVRFRARISSGDISKLNFKDFIQVDNINYRLNKISDYNPITDGTCIVELSKIKDGIDYVPLNISWFPKASQYIIQGGIDEVRSLTATSPYTVVQGGIDEVQKLFSDSNIQIITGGLD